jgi:hypothetical protein
MDKLFAIAGSKRGKRRFRIRVLLLVVMLGFAISSLPAARAFAGDGDSPPPGIGSLDDYMHEGMPPGQVYNPHQQNAEPEGPGYYTPPGYNAPPGNYGPGNYGPPPGYGSPSGGQMAVGAAVVGALIVAALAYHQYQVHQEQRAWRRYRRHHHGQLPPPPPGYGF